MSLIIGPVVESDLPSICEIRELAFSPNPCYRLLYPLEVDIAAAKLERHRQSFFASQDSPMAKLYDAQTGEIASYCHWTKKEGDFEVEKRTPKSLTAWPEGVNKALMDQFFEAIYAKTEELMSGRPHFLLSILVTNPKYQKRGAASRLLDWGVAQADAAGIPAYLEATPGAVGLYKSRGFEETGRVDFDLGDFGGHGDYSMIAMLRPFPGSNETPE
ncbi:MAG: hypothetical protein M4579_001070 [Chaenotheca gracillima]|nr:MAG: hypothetical protein M4579_001070 [Chaenotheca gracillima]